MRGWLARLTLLGLLWAPVLAAQFPPVTGADTSALTARFLEADAETRRIITPLARPGADGILPPLSRVIFTRDSIESSNVSTVGDLLQQIPGVYLLRAGWIGQAAVPVFRGQGPRSVEYFIDGVPHLPIGADSTMVDPSMLPLSFYDRIEVDRLPGLLRVHLYTRRHDRLAARTRVAITSGDLDISRYQGSLERRFESGLGFAAAFDFLGVASLARPNENDYQNTNAMVQASWVPNPKRGLSVQYFLSGPRRLAILGGGATTPDTLARGHDESRRDLQARFYLRQRTDGLGGGIDVVASRTSWGMDSPVDTIPDAERRISQIGLIAGYRTPVASVTGSAWRRSDWTPLDVTVAGAASPVEIASGSLEVGYRRHDFDRTSRWVTARAGLGLPLGFVVNGTVRNGVMVEYPMVESDTAREVRERSATLGWETKMLGLEVGYAKTSAPTPAPYWTYPQLGIVGHAGDAEWRTARVRVTPRNWVTLDGWYSEPLGDAGAEGQPPTHSMITGAIRSKFMRVFPSGIFELKVAMSVESFGTGTLGRGTDGEPITLRGASFARAQLQLQFGPFTAYLDRQNTLDSDAGWVPGIPTLRAANAFGIRWVFWN
ncbi:MAG: TonB-dependent receptor plug domain-containing protein [Gemmatimonadales bacterium]